MDWQTIAIAVASFMIGLILGRSMGGGSRDSIPATPRFVPPATRGSGPHKVQLQLMGPNKISVIKEVRAMTGLGLKDAKDLVESAPCEVLAGLDAASAEQYVQLLNAAGARAVVI